VDVVLQTSYQNDTVLFFRQMKDQGFKPKAVIGAGGGYSTRDTVVAVGPENMEGALDVDFTQYHTNPRPLRVSNSSSQSIRRSTTLIPAPGTASPTTWARRCSSMPLLPQRT